MMFTIDVSPDGEKVEQRRALAEAFALAGGFRLLVGRDVEERLQIQTLIKQALGWGLALTLLLGLAGGFLMSRGMLGRVDAINRTTRRIMAGDFSQRIALRGSRDEFDELAANLNAMLDQIERLLAGMRQVTDNIAHDLRTPLNRLRSRIEVALLREPGRAESRALLEETLADAEAMIGTFNALLEIARAEAGSERGAFEDVELEALGHDLDELYRPLAEDKGLAFEFQCAPGLRIRANRHLLAQALSNLLDNAVKYTPKGGRVCLAHRARPERADGHRRRQRSRHSGRGPRAGAAAVRSAGRHPLDSGQRPRPQPGRCGREAASRRAVPCRQPAGPQGQPRVPVLAGRRRSEGRGLIRARHSALSKTSRRARSRPTSETCKPIEPRAKVICAARA